MPRKTVITQQNYVLWSQDLTNAVWTIDNSGGSLPVITGNYSVAPDNTLTATRVQLDITGGTFSRIQQNCIPDAKTYTFSVWMKTNNSTTKIIDVRLFGTDNNVTVTGVWQRFSITNTNVAGGAQILLFTSSSTSTTADLSVWGAQLVQATSPGNYIKTTNSTINVGNNIRNTASSRTTVPNKQNFLLWSQDLTNNVWSIDNSGGSLPIVTGNYTTAPDGSLTATRVQLNITSGGTFSRISQTKGIVSSGLLTFSVWMKTNDGTTKIVDMRMDGVDQNVTVTGSWQRFSVQSTNTNSMQILLFSISSTSTTADLAVWGAQLVQANWAGFYVLTTNAYVNQNMRNI